jgi:RecB family endonuclease NucS
MPLPSLDSIKLKKTGQKWEFQSEAYLEDFVWSLLDELFDASPIKRQFSINGQFCDILALGQESNLLLVELKNEEDRYIVNQLTRYYDALAEAQALSEVIDYSKPIQLIAIAPRFHRDNLSDQKYNRLPIKFLQFDLVERFSKVFFTLSDLDGQEIKAIEIPHHEKPHEASVPGPTRRFLNLLAHVSDENRPLVLGVREQILGFHSQIKEFSLSSSILYGASKTKPFVEFRYDESRKTVALFLWLPHVTSASTRARRIVARMRVWTDWTVISAVGHVPKGLGRMISFEEWKSASVRPLNKLLPSKAWVDSDSKSQYFTDASYRERFVEKRKYLRLNPHYKSGLALGPEIYFSLIGKAESSLFLRELVALALETGLEKL